MKKGEITAFLSLIFLLVLSFAGAMVESASIQVLKNQKRADTSLAMESVFAEYQKEMLKEYDIFTLDGGYGTGQAKEESVLRRLDYYGADFEENSIEKSELLTDAQGWAFYEQAVRYMENKLGLDGISHEKEEVSAWEEREENRKESEEEEQHVQEELDSMLEETQESLPEENNPMQSISNIKTSGLLQIIVPDLEQLSNKSIKQEEMPSVRNLNKGKGKFPNHTVVHEAEGKVFFQAYLMEHFSDITQTGGDKPLDYELEYLIGGCESDKKNLETVMKKILAIRFAVNAAYLYTDEEKKAEAEVLALGLCSLLTAVGITEVVKHAVLLAWAYGESIVDLRVLAAGKKSPAVKNRENWQLGLSALLKLGSGENEEQGKESESGMSYRDYVRGLLLLEKRETLSMRALDLIEGDLKIPADNCVMRLEVKSRCHLRRGIWYEFPTYFEYQ